MDYKLFIMAYIIIVHLVLLSSSLVNSQTKKLEGIIPYDTPHLESFESKAPSQDNQSILQIDNHSLSNNNEDDLYNFGILLSIPSSFIALILLTLLLIWKRDKTPAKARQTVAKMKKIMSQVKNCTIELETLCYLCLEQFGSNTDKEEINSLVISKTSCNLTKLPCGHSYHCSCLNHWKQLNESKSIDLQNEVSQELEINYCPRCKENGSNESDVDTVRNSLVHIQLRINPSLSQMSFITDKKEIN